MARHHRRYHHQHEKLGLIDSIKKWFTVEPNKSWTNFHPRKNVGYGPKEEEWPTPHCESLSMRVIFHDRKTRETYEGSFKVLGDKTSIIRHRSDDKWLKDYERETNHLFESGIVPCDSNEYNKKIWKHSHIPTEKIYVSTKNLRFEKHTSRNFPDGVHHTLDIRYDVYILDYD
jgi:hypothetical protein